MAKIVLKDGTEHEVNNGVYSAFVEMDRIITEISADRQDVQKGWRPIAKIIQNTDDPRKIGMMMTSDRVTEDEMLDYMRQLEYQIIYQKGANTPKEGMKIIK